MRDLRASRLAQEVIAVDHVLRHWAEAEHLTPGQHAAPELFTAASQATARRAQRGATLPDGSPLPDEIGPRIFYRVADNTLGTRR